jgi:hypothetical protein
MNGTPAQAQEELWRALTLSEADPDPARFLDALLESSSLSDDDRAFLREQGPNRLLVYRRLVRTTLRDAVELSMPRAAARMKAISGSPDGHSLFQEVFDAYVSEVGTRSHYLRDIAPELLAFCAERYADDPRLPASLLELGRLESAEIEVAAAPTSRELHGPSKAPEESAISTGDELELDRGVRFIDACRLFRFEHAVHRLPSAPDDRSEPAREKTFLLVYRSTAHEVRYLELSAVAEAILRRLLGGLSLRTSLVAGCVEQGVPLDDAVLAGAAQVLSDLGQRGVLLGAREAAHDAP